MRPTTHLKKITAAMLTMLMLFSLHPTALAEGPVEQIEPFDYDVDLDTAGLTAIGCTTSPGAVMDENGQTQQCLNITLPAKTAEQWKALFFGPFNGASDANSFAVSTHFTFPAGTKWFAYVGTRIDLGDAAAINVMKNIPFQIDDLNSTWAFSFASVTYDGAKAILTPVERDKSLLIEYMDKDDVLHYTRLNYTIRYGSPATSYVMENVAPLPSRVIADPGFGGTYGDGTVSYTISSNPGGPLSIVTRVAPPTAVAASAKSLRVNSEVPITITGGYAGYSYVYQGNSRQYTEPLKLEWLDESGSLICAEMMSINIIPAFSGKWVDTLWQPVRQDRTSAHSGAVNAGAKLSYDPTEGIWRFTIDDNKLDSLNMGYFTKYYSDLIFVTPPEGAAYYLWYMSHDPLYANGFQAGAQSYFAGEVSNGRYETVSGAIPVPYSQPCSSTVMDATNGDLTVFTVNRTMTGYANYVIFQWYDSNHNLIESSGKSGEYVLLIMDPFYRTTSSQITENPVSATAQTGPTAVSDKSDSLAYTLKTQTPIQTNGSADTDQLVMNLIYLDESGKEVQPAAGETVTVYLPYPHGVTYETADRYVFTLRHYQTSDLNGESALVELVPTVYGLRFHTDSFSPFLRTVSKKTIGTGNGSVPSYRIAYSGGNAFDTNGTVKKVEVDGVDTPFAQNGGKLILSSLTDGAHAVRATFSDGSILTVNISAYNTVTAASVNVPQTGDRPAGTHILLLAAAALAAAALGFRRKRRS